MERDEIKVKAFELFDKMKPGTCLVISEIAKRDPSAFIEYGKAYIDSGKWNYEFSSDYSRFKRLSLDIDKIYE